MIKKHGLPYCWLLDLFPRLKLPQFDGMAETLQKANILCYKNLEKKWNDRAKEKRTQYKGESARTRRASQHTYGTSTEDDDDNSATRTKIMASSSKLSNCQCGSTQHSTPVTASVP